MNKKGDVSIIYSKNGQEKCRFENCLLQHIKEDLFAYTSSEKIVYLRLDEGESIVVEREKI
jgi:hypothetical protein